VFDSVLLRLCLGVACAVTLVPICGRAWPKPCSNCMGQTGYVEVIDKMGVLVVLHLLLLPTDQILKNELFTW
jgi:hypothetical protein